jgi:hypothetical protein
VSRRAGPPSPATSPSRHSLLAPCRRVGDVSSASVGPPSPPSSPAGWRPDPTARFELRYFNGDTWTADVSTAGQRLVDPLGSPGRRRDGRATAAMVLGIVGVTTGWMPFLFVAGAICAVLGIVFGALVLRRRSDPRGFALTGVITGVAGLALVVVGVMTTRVVSDAVTDFIDEPAAMIDLARCAATDGSVLIEGSIENLGEAASDFRIVVAVGTLPSNQARVVIEVDDVRPKAPAPFRVAEQLDLLGEPSDVVCEVVDVTGPLPFGLDF